MPVWQGVGTVITWFWKWRGETFQTCSSKARVIFLVQNSFCVSGESLYEELPQMMLPLALPCSPAVPWMTLTAEFQGWPKPALPVLGPQTSSPGQRFDIPGTRAPCLLWISEFAGLWDFLTLSSCVCQPLFIKVLFISAISYTFLFLGLPIFIQITWVHVQQWQLL